MPKRVTKPMPVTFISPGGQTLTIRMQENSVDAIINSAKSLKARFIVFQDDYDVARNLPVWAVVNVQKAERMANAWVMPLPERNFTTETDDAPVMWAIVQMGLQA